MREVRPERYARRNAGAKARVARIASRQFGLITRTQLDFGRARVKRWVDEGYLFPIHPGVYGVGHRPAGFDGALAAALLYAGPGAMLDRLSAACWIGILDGWPCAVQVATPRRCRSCSGVDVRDRRPAERVWLPGVAAPRAAGAPARLLPVTSIPRLALDLARILNHERLRHALARLEFQGRLELAALERVCGPGVPGSGALRRALRDHQPLLALTRSELERLLIRLCERHGLPMAEINARFGRWILDAVWWKQKVVVEVDGKENHSTWAQIKRDRRKDLELRAAGFLVLRYTYDQVRFEGAKVAADIRAALVERGPA